MQFVFVPTDFPTAVYLLSFAPRLSGQCNRHEEVFRRHLIYKITWRRYQVVLRFQYNLSVFFYSFMVETSSELTGRSRARMYSFDRIFSSLTYLYTLSICRALVISTATLRAPATMKSTNCVGVRSESRIHIEMLGIISTAVFEQFLSYERCTSHSGVASPCSGQTLSPSAKQSRSSPWLVIKWRFPRHCGLSLVCLSRVSKTIFALSRGPDKDSVAMRLNFTARIQIL